MNYAISAICVTHSSRLGLLQRAVINFLGQTETDAELIIMTNEEGYLDSIRSFLRDPRLEDLFPKVDIHQRITVYGGKYREAVEGFIMGAARATGDYLAAWDDDNLSHPDRLAFQADRTPSDRATCFAESLYYFYDSNELFVTNYAQPSGKPSERCAAASVMFHRHLLPSLELTSRELWTDQVLNKLALLRAYDFINGRPELFLVGANGNNARNEDLHRKLGTGLPATWKRDQLMARSEEIETWLKAYQFPTAVVDVAGKDAAAFQVTDVIRWPAWLESVLPPEDWHVHLPNKAVQEQQNAERQVQEAAKKAVQ